MNLEFPNLNRGINIQGVKFFESADECISNLEKKHWTKKAISLIQNYGTLVVYALHRTRVFLRKTKKKMAPYTDIHPSDLSKEKLVVCLHGLNSNPSQFEKILKETEQQSIPEKTAFYIPRILDKGNAPLDNMVRPIFDKVIDWARTPGDKEIVLIGISNGARIARALEIELAKSQDAVSIKQYRFISIVGACKGTVLVNRANKLGLSRLMSKSISQEMPTTSPRIQRLNAEWNQNCFNQPTHHYTFIASPHDWHVPNYSSSLMKVGQNQKAHYAIVPGHGHNSIVNAVAATVAEITSPAILSIIPSF